jgi:hypothetical protein
MEGFEFSRIAENEPAPTLLGVSLPSTPVRAMGAPQFPEIGGINVIRSAAH